ncbi:MAG: IS200/IS605 family accessory protein TnpB-related protein [Nitrosopumilaceae archaeon]
MFHNLKAIKSVRQPFVPDQNILNFLETFRYMVNHCIRIGLQNDCSTLKKLSTLSYHELGQYEILSYYKLGAISQAAGILSNRKQSIRRGIHTKKPYMKKPILISCYGFKIEDGVFRIPLGDRKYFEIPLNTYTRQILSDPTLKVHSFCLTAFNINMAISKEIGLIECTKTVGIDRNLKNITVGDCTRVVQYDLSKTVKIAENTKSIYSSLKRNDHRIMKKLYSKYGTRRKNRINQILHKASKTIVKEAAKDQTAIIFEDIRHIRKLYQKGNGQGKKYRGRLNGWSFAEIKRQIEYKANWEGIPVIQLSKKETRGTSTLCPACGKRLQEQRASRELWCEFCQRWLDRDVVAVMNQSLRGLSRFDSSKGVANEAMVQELGTPIILQVDATKLCQRE